MAEPDTRSAGHHVHHREGSDGQQPQQDHGEHAPPRDRCGDPLPLGTGQARERPASEQVAKAEAERRAGQRTAQGIERARVRTEAERRAQHQDVEREGDAPGHDEGREDRHEDEGRAPPRGDQAGQLLGLQPAGQRRPAPHREQRDEQDQQGHPADGPPPRPGTPPPRGRRRSPPGLRARRSRAGCCPTGLLFSGRENDGLVLTPEDGHVLEPAAVSVLCSLTFVCNCHRPVRKLAFSFRIPRFLDETPQLNLERRTDRSIPVTGRTPPAASHDHLGSIHGGHPATGLRLVARGGLARGSSRALEPERLEPERLEPEASSAKPTIRGYTHFSPCRAARLTQRSGWPSTSSR